MTIERIDYWDRCLGAGQFNAAVRAFPVEAQTIFGTDALGKREPTMLALIVFARRTQLMSDAQIEEMEARIRQEVAGVEISDSNDFHHCCVPLKEGDTITPPPIVALSQEILASDPQVSPVKRVREMSKRILLRNGLD